MNKNVIVPDGVKPSATVIAQIDSFMGSFHPYEVQNDCKLILYFDKKSAAYYLVCHLDAASLISSCDLEATLDGSDEDEIYKLNREITEDQVAFKAMEKDATQGRTFEDMVFEFGTSYKNEQPLKVYGGQHRIRAITNGKQNAVIHGVRVYFSLTRDQKVEIATVNNTAIAVPNDLLDRMREQLLGSQLRDWCQSVGMLEKSTDFSDRKSQDVPTVRIVRTLLVNYHLGLDANEDTFHQPIVCKSGGADDSYLNLRGRVKWSDAALKQMGTEYARLHKIQKERVQARSQDKNMEFARKALSLSVVAAWGYAAGLFQKKPDALKQLYALPESAVAPEDPLNAQGLSQARLKGTDPDTYRGLGTRSSPPELGRMLEVFLVFATKAAKKKITKELANAAIQSYEAKKASCEADKALGKI